MKIAAIYVRKSIRTGKGESIKSQIDMCKQYAKDRGIVVNDSFIYYDEGYSGKDLNRPKFKQMLNDLNKNNFNILLCYRLDRISRSINDFSNLINLLNKNDISFISIKEQFDTSTAMGKSMMYIASIFSELERETISERIRDNFHSLARSGRWLGGTCPTGFKSMKATILDSNLRQVNMYKLYPIEGELTLIKTLFELFLKFRDLSILEKYCFNNGIKSRNNYAFTQTSLKQILVNPVYCIADQCLYDYLYSRNFSISNKKSEFTGEFGVLLYRINEESIISLATHRGIIKSIDWVSTQMIISTNNSLPSRQGTSSIGVLSGIIYCSICNSLMRVKYGRKTKTGISYYYLCTLKEKNKDNCESLNLKGNYIDAIVFQEINPLLKSTNFISSLIKYINLDRDYINNTEISSTDNNIDHGTNGELDLLSERLKILKHQLNVNSSSHAYILEQIKSINKKIVITKESLSKYPNAQENFESLNQLSDFFKKMPCDFDQSILTFEERQYLVNKTLTSVNWNNRELTIDFI